jgi:isopenicillin N synthase-like dioxygenase
MEGVPVLDLADPSERVGRELRRGLETTGFVVLEGHGVPLGWIERAYAAIERFFGLPEAVKLEVAAGPDGQRGFTPFGIEHARDSATPDLKEFFHVGRDRYAANRWPEALPELRDALSPLYAALDRCAAQLLTTLAHAFDLPEPTFSSLLHEGNSILRALHYPPLREASDRAALRAAPHEDINLVTLLCGATDAGLEIETPSGWRAVDTKRHQIVADSGDMLRQVTGGVIPSTTHRVVNPPDAANRSRYSLPFFAHPAPECDLSVLPKFATTERTAAFPPITAGAFLEQRLAEIGLGT